MPHTLAHNQVDLWTVWICLKIRMLVLRVPKERMNRLGLSLSDVCQLVAQIECATPMALGPFYVPPPDLTR